MYLSPVQRAQAGAPQLSWRLPLQTTTKPSGGYLSRQFTTGAHDMETNPKWGRPQWGEEFISVSDEPPRTPDNGGPPTGDYLYKWANGKGAYGKKKYFQTSPRRLPFQACWRERSHLQGPPASTTTRFYLPA